MTDNPIIAEVRTARKEYAARFNNNLAAMVADLREKQAKSGRKVVRYPPRRLESPPDTQAGSVAPPDADEPPETKSSN